MGDGIGQARQTAAALLRADGREEDARRILRGQGDDYPEVRLAAAILGANAERLGRMERALRCYADPTFWDEENPEAALAFHDRGDIARNVLQGKELFAQHRD